MRWIYSILDWVGRWQTAQAVLSFFKPIIWPTVVALITGWLGVAGHQPWMWVCMASALSFMGVMVGIFFGGTYRERQSPLNKLRYNGTMVNYDLTPLGRKSRRAQQTGAVPARTLDRVQVGVALHNAANFPIVITLERAETKMEDHRPPRSMPKQPTTILPGNTVWVMDDPIDMAGHPCEKLEGHMDLSIRYGREGRQTLHLKFAGRVEVLMRPEGFIGGTYTHWDSELANIPTR